MSSLKTVSRETNRVKQGQGPRSQRPGPFFGPRGGRALIHAPGPADRGPRPASPRPAATRATGRRAPGRRAPGRRPPERRAGEPQAGEPQAGGHQGDGPAATRATGRRAPGRRPPGRPAGARYPAHGPRSRPSSRAARHGRRAAGQVMQKKHDVMPDRSDTRRKKTRRAAGLELRETGQLRPACPRARPARPAWHRPCPGHRPYRR